MWRNPARLLVLTAMMAVLLVVSPATFATAQEGEGRVTGSPGILTPDYPYLAPDVLAFRDRTAKLLSGRVSLMAQGLDAQTGGIGGSEAQSGPVASGRHRPPDRVACSSPTAIPRLDSVETS